MNGSSAHSTACDGFLRFNPLAMHCVSHPLDAGAGADPYLERQCGVIVDYDTELHLHNGVLRRACDIRRNEHVLDIGCGAGLTTRSGAKCGNGTGVGSRYFSGDARARPRVLAEAEELYQT